MVKIICCGSRSGILFLFDPGSGMEKFGSKISIPDPHCALVFLEIIPDLLSNS